AGVWPGFGAVTPAVRGWPDRPCGEGARDVRSYQHTVSANVPKRSHAGRDGRGCADLVAYSDSYAGHPPPTRQLEQANVIESPASAFDRDRPSRAAGPSIPLMRV